MRSIKELLQVTLNHIYRLKRGLCGLVYELQECRIITLEEYVLLKKYLEAHRPFNIYNMLGSAFYWKPCASKPRIKWLKKHIKRQS